MSISEIAVSLEQKGVKVGDKTLRSILTNASGTRLKEKRVGRGKKLYRLNLASQFGSSRKKKNYQGEKRSISKKI